MVYDYGNVSPIWHTHKKIDSPCIKHFFFEGGGVEKSLDDDALWTLSIQAVMWNDCFLCVSCRRRAAVTTSVSFNTQPPRHWTEHGHTKAHKKQSYCVWYIELTTTYRDPSSWRAHPSYAIRTMRVPGNRVTMINNKVCGKIAISTMIFPLFLFFF